LPLGRRRFGPGAAVAVLIHAAVVGALLIRGHEILKRGQGGSRAPGEARVNFFAIPAGAPAAVDMALPARLTPFDLSALRRIHVELPPVELRQTTLPPPPPPAALGGAGGNVGGGGGGGVRGRPPKSIKTPFWAKKPKNDWEIPVGSRFRAKTLVYSGKYRLPISTYGRGT